MRKVAAVVLTTGLLLGTVAFGALAQGRDTEDRKCQKPGKACCCDQEQQKEEPAPWAKKAVGKDEDPAPWEKPFAGEKEQPGCSERCSGERENPPSPGKCDHCQAADGNWRGDPCEDRCEWEQERPRCYERCRRVDETDGEWQEEPCEDRCDWEGKQLSHPKRVHKCERCGRLLDIPEDESPAPAEQLEG